MLRMLLTSAGIRNDTLVSELARLVGRRFAATRLVFLPDASLAAAGDHGWLVEDLNRVYQLGWREFDVLALNGLPAAAAPSFPNRTRAWLERAAARLDFPVYALDDESAVRVRGEAVDVVSEGRWYLLNGPGGETGRRPAGRRRLRLPGTGGAVRPGRRSAG